ILGVDTDDDDTHPLVDLDRARHNEVDPFLVSSIVEHGVRIPVEAVKYGDRLCVVDGRRRTIHARVANNELVTSSRERRKIRAIISNAEVGEETRVDAIIANNFRRNHAPVAQAKQIERLLVDGYSAQAIATMMGMSPASVSNRRKLLACTDKVQRA